MSPSSHQLKLLTTQPERVTETFLLPLRTVVASSSATRSSRSAQQSPPRSAALAGVALNANPPTTKPSAAAMAMRLDVFVSPPNISISTFPDKLPNPNSRFEFASRPVRTSPREMSKIPRLRVLIRLYAFRQEGKLLSKQARAFLIRCDISATKLTHAREADRAAVLVRKCRIRSIG